MNNSNNKNENMAVATTGGPVDESTANGKWPYPCPNTNSGSSRHGSTIYYIDGEKVGMVPYNLRTPISYIGNVSEEEYGLLSQQWGIIADLRVFRRALTGANLKLLIPSADHHG